MKHENFNLRRFLNEEVNVTPVQFCRSFDVSCEEEQQWEKTFQIPQDLMWKIIMYYGLELEQIMKYCTVPVVFSVPDWWVKNREILNYLLEQIVSLEKRVFIEKESDRNHLMDCVREAFRKPCVFVTGGYDTGKSSLINHLIGSGVLPCAYAPHTSIPVYLKHLEDCPSCLKENSVWILKKGEDGSACDVNRLHDPLYTEKYLLDSGDFSVLKAYGTYSGGNSEKADCAVVFVESEILKCCDIVDTPGLYAGKKEQVELPDKIDILIYTSHVAGFMNHMNPLSLYYRLERMDILERNGENDFNKLSNLFILGTMASSLHLGDYAEKNAIRQSFLDRFWETMDDRKKMIEKWSSVSGYEYGREDIGKRVFFYDQESIEFQGTFPIHFKNLLHKISVRTYESGKGRICFELENFRQRKKENLKWWQEALNNSEIEIMQMKERLVTSSEYREKREKIRKWMDDRVEEGRSQFTVALYQKVAHYFSRDNILMLYQNKEILMEGQEENFFNAVILEFNRMITDEINSKARPILEEGIGKLSSFYGAVGDDAATVGFLRSIDYIEIVEKLKSEVVVFQKDNLWIAYAGVLVANMNMNTIPLPVGSLVGTGVITLILSWGAGLLWNTIRLRKTVYEFINSVNVQEATRNAEEETSAKWDELKMLLRQMDEECHKKMVEKQEEWKAILRTCQEDRNKAQEEVERLRYIDRKLGKLVDSIKEMK